MNESASIHWNIFGIAEIEQEKNKIKLPTELVNEGGVFYPDGDIHFYYEQVLGTCLISHTRLKESIPEGTSRAHNNPSVTQHYKYVDNTSVDTIENSDGEITWYRSVVPKQFFSDYQGQAKGAQPEPKKAQLEYGGQYYATARDGMISGDTRSAYLLKAHELAELISNNDTVAGVERAREKGQEDEFPGFDSIPEFL